MNINIKGNIPEEIFTGVSSVLDTSCEHIFGCPVYTLESKLQSGLGGISKWEPRSRLGIYVDHSPAHAGNIGLVINPRTSLISPQYHIVFDNIFSTAPFIRSATVAPT